MTSDKKPKSVSQFLFAVWPYLLFFGVGGGIVYRSVTAGPTLTGTIVAGVLLSVIMCCYYAIVYVRS